MDIIRKHIFIEVLTPILVLLRWLLCFALLCFALLCIAMGADIAIELAEVYLQKDFHHLALSAICFLLANL